MRANWGILWLGLAVLGVQAWADTQPLPRVGRAIIAGVEGAATAETPEGPLELGEGMALSQGYAITTREASSVCALLTPGALICVHENSRAELVDLQHVLEGLPQPGQAPRGRAVLYLERGAVFVHGMKSPEGLVLTIKGGPGVTFEASRAEFIVARDKDGDRLFVEEGEVVVRRGDVARPIQAGQSALVAPGAAGEIDVDDSLDGSDGYNFFVCRELFDLFSPLAADFTWDGFERAAPTLMGGAPLVWVSRPSEALDLSPITRQPGGGFQVGGAPAFTGGGDAGGIRRRTDMWVWYRGVGTQRGFNYLPRTAVNSTEMWQLDTFDPGVIKEELGWARESGLNAVRVFLPFVVWQDDADGLKERFKQFLDLADDQGMRVVPVLFDDYNPHGIDPYTGPQRPATPGVHNSQWTPSPGPARVTDREGAWPALEQYVRDVVDAFAGDDRVLFWDLYNDTGRSGMGAASVPLAEAALGWARAERPDQPLTAGISTRLPAHASDALMQRCDLISFSAFESRDELESAMVLAGLRGRPVICTGWLDRTRGLTFSEALPLFARERVGWFHWGLVAGESQLNVPRSPTPDGLWPQALLKPDGIPYDQAEVDQIRRFVFQEN